MNGLRKYKKEIKEEIEKNKKLKQKKWYNKI
jgi:hypothetical protein